MWGVKIFISVRSKITLLLSDLSWHIAGAVGLRICEIVYEAA